MASNTNNNSKRPLSSSSRTTRQKNSKQRVVTAMSDSNGDMSGMNSTDKQNEARRKSSIKKSNTSTSDSNKRVEFSNENQVFYDQKTPPPASQSSSLQPKKKEKMQSSEGDEGTNEHEQRNGDVSNSLAQLHNIHRNLEEQLAALESMDTKADNKDFIKEKLDDIMTMACTGQQTIGSANKDIKEYSETVAALRDLILRVKSVVSDKFLTTDLKTLVGPTKPITAEEELKGRKDRIARIGELRQMARQANAELTRLEELADELEAAVLEAMEEAEVAAKDVIEASEAAKAARERMETESDSEEAKLRERELREEEEEKRRREEEERLKEEERRREEEEKRRKEEEERKQKAEEEEKKRQEEEKRKQDEERKRREKDEFLKSLEQYIYSVDPGDSDIGLGCVIRSSKSVLADQDILTTERLQPHEEGLIKLEENEELVSNVIKITSNNGNLQFDPPVMVAIPNYHSRSMTSREAVIKKRLQDGKWAEMSTRDVVIEDIKEYRFAETDVSAEDASIILMVVTRIKRDKAAINKKNPKMTSSVDSRVSVTFKPERSTSSALLEVQPFDGGQLSEMRERHPEESRKMLGNSPIVMLSVEPHLLKNVSLQLPLPQNAHKKATRPGTAAVHASGDSTDGSFGKQRPTTAAVGRKKEDDQTDIIHVLQKTNSLWTVRSDVSVTEIRSKDLATVDFNTIDKMNRFMVMRTEAGLASFIVEKLAEIIEQSIRQRTVQFVLRKRADDERNAVICCTLSSKLDRLMRSLDEEGYTKGPQPSPEISMCEGQKIRIRFSGNVQEVNGRELKMTFHAQLPTRCTFRASEVDYFGQKALECYRGRVKIFSSKPASSQPSPPAGKSANTGSGKNAQHAVPVAHHDEEVCLCDLELSIPKPENDIRPMSSKVRVQLKLEGVVTETMLKDLSREMDEEWKKLAQILGIKTRRLQDIERVKSDAPLEEIIYEMLITWIKSVQRSSDKATILMNALKNCGRSDLAHLLNERQQLALSSRQASARRSVRIEDDEDPVFS